VKSINFSCSYISIFLTSVRYQWWDSTQTHRAEWCQQGTPPANQSTIQRKWPCRDPLNSVLDPYFTCNVDGSANSALHAVVAAGGIIAAHYDKNFSINEVSVTGVAANPNETWGHAWGPIMAYMARCPDTAGGCADVDVNIGEKIWFKVDEGGLESGTAGQGKWRQKDLADGLPWNVKVPESLKPGKYLLRNEVVALHVKPHQWYMECAQFEVTGEGDALPSEDYLVGFPGAYDPEGQFEDTHDREDC
jgi:lytic cellulose monooxygenase (C1-hydroxylating)